MRQDRIRGMEDGDLAPIGENGQVRTDTGDPEEAARFVDFSDMPNVRLCLEKTAEADLQLQLDRSGDYQLVSEKKNGETESGQ